jgi:SSS family solute:Na+ symporter
VFVALIAAIIASMGSKINSIATIFTIDVFKTIKKDASERLLVIVGRITAIVALLIAMVTAQPLLGSFDQAFQYIQEFTGFFTPGIVVIFLLGMFWKRATEAGALAAAVGSVGLSIVFKYLAGNVEAVNRLGHLFSMNDSGIAQLRVYMDPFMNRMGYVCLICFALAITVSLMQKPKPQTVTVELTDIDYSTSKSFWIASVAVISILIALYATWW